MATVLKSTEQQIKTRKVMALEPPRINFLLYPSLGGVLALLDTCGRHFSNTPISSSRLLPSTWSIRIPHPDKLSVTIWLVLDHKMWAEMTCIQAKACTCMSVLSSRMRSYPAEANPTPCIEKSVSEDDNGTLSRWAIDWWLHRARHSSSPHWTCGMSD